MIDSYSTKCLLLKNIISKNIINLSLAIEALRFLEGIQSESARIPNKNVLDINLLEMYESEFLDDYLFLSNDIDNKCDNFILNSSNDQRDIDRAARYSYVKRFLMKSQI